MGKPTTRGLARKHSVVLNEARRFDTTGKIKRKEEARNWNGKSVVSKIGALAQGVIGTLTLAYQSAKASAQQLQGTTLYQQGCVIFPGQGGSQNPVSTGCGWRNKVSFGNPVMHIPGLNTGNQEAVAWECKDLIYRDPCGGKPPAQLYFKPYPVFAPSVRCNNDTGVPDEPWDGQEYSKEDWFKWRPGNCTKTMTTQPASLPTTITTPIINGTTSAPDNPIIEDVIVLGSALPVVGIAALFSITGVAYIANKVFGRRCCPNKVRSKPRHQPNNTNERLSRRAQYDLELARAHQTTTV